MAENHEEVAQETGDPRHWAAAALWAEAAEEEAKGLSDRRGDWIEYEDWLHTASGRASKKAEVASKSLGIDTYV
jgi:hypothetical protein